MGLTAVLGWVMWTGQPLPRWLWCVIAADLIFAIPRSIEFYGKYFH